MSAFSVRDKMPPKLVGTCIGLAMAGYGVRILTIPDPSVHQWKGRRTNLPSFLVESIGTVPTGLLFFTAGIVVLCCVWLAPKLWTKLNSKH